MSCGYRLKALRISKTLQASASGQVAVILSILVTNLHVTQDWAQAEVFLFSDRRSLIVMPLAAGVSAARGRGSIPGDNVRHYFLDRAPVSDAIVISFS